MLVTLRLPPGEVVQEKELTLKTGIGRTPVREAIQQLAAYGLIRIMPRKGLMIVPILRSELSQVIEARRVLERLMVVKAAERATTVQRETIQNIGGEFERAGGNPESFLRLDGQLDELLAAACGNPYLARGLAPLHAHCRRLWYLHHDRHDMELAAQRHAGLAKAVAAEDGSGAIRALNGIIAKLEELVGNIDVIS